MFRRFAVLLATAAAVAMVVIFLTEQAVEAAGAETQVMIRAISKDAMVIGTKVGGARITVRDLATGAILAQGIQEGTSGNVDLIMKQSRIRGVNVFDAPGTAGFLAKLALMKPTEVVVAAEGPLGSPESLQWSSKTLLLVPGQDVLGDGIVLELNGFIVKLLSPGPEAQPASAGALKVRATVHML